MADQERKGKKAEKHDEADEKEAVAKKAAAVEAADEEGSHEEGSDEEEASDEEGSDEEEEEASDEEEEEERSAKAGSGEDSEEEDAEEGDAAARRMAKALGVGDEPEAEGEAKGDEQAPANRAARRAEAAQRRKKRRDAAASARSTDEDEPLPRDKNARAKELLKRRREQAEGGTRPIQLLPGEMVDDALARGSSAVSKWVKENFSILQWVIVGALVAGGGYLFYTVRGDRTAAEETDGLIAGINADRGQVMAEDKRPDEEKEVSTLKVFKTADERADTALASYKRVVTEHPGSGAAILARLGEAGDYLDKHDYDHAIEGFSAVAASSLASADADVKTRALEGLGFAKEGKGDLDGALAAFKDLEGVSKELGLYHQGRIWLAKGDKDKAKDALKQVHDKLEQPTGSQRGYLQQMTDEMLRRIDPDLVPNKAPVLGGPKGNAKSPEELEKMRRLFEDAMKKGQQQKEQH